MEKIVSAAEANRRFSELLRMVKKGQSVVVTSHGKLVAKIMPIAENDATVGKARSALLERLRTQRVTKAGRWTREELYIDGRK